MEIITNNAKETQEFGRKLSTNLKTGTVIALKGDLGSGKTTFTQGFGEGLGIDRVISPTFILMRMYELNDKNLSVENFYHLDLYRLEGDVEKQLLDLGVKEIWDNPRNMVLIEWAEKAIGVMPEKTKWINFEYVDENKRKITMEK